MSMEVTQMFEPLPIVIAFLQDAKKHGYILSPDEIALFELTKKKETARALTAQQNSTTSEGVVP